MWTKPVPVAVVDEIVAGEQPAGAVAERVLVLRVALEVLAVEAADDLVALPAALLGHAGEQQRRDDVISVSSPAHPHQRVAERGVVGHGQVGRQRPGRRRPDQDEGVGMADHRELHVDALADVVLVFDLRLGQRGAARDAPIHRLLAAIDEALLDDVGEQPQFVGLVVPVQGQVGMSQSPSTPSRLNWSRWMSMYLRA